MGEPREKRSPSYAISIDPNNDLPNRGWPDTSSLAGEPEKKPKVSIEPKLDAPDEKWGEWLLHDATPKQFVRLGFSRKEVDVIGAACASSDDGQASELYMSVGGRAKEARKNLNLAMSQKTDDIEIE